MTVHEASRMRSYYYIEGLHFEFKKGNGPVQERHNGGIIVQKDAEELLEFKQQKDI
jgi:hypothetical protein